MLCLCVLVELWALCATYCVMLYGVLRVVVCFVVVCFALIMLNLCLCALEIHCVML